MPKALKFERTMQLFFGWDKPYQIAGSANNPKERKKWVLKLIKNILQRIDFIDTTPDHKELIKRSIEVFSDSVNTFSDATWEMIYDLFVLIGHLLGYTRIHQKPVVLYSLTYSQNEGQYYTEHMLQEVYPLKEDKHNASAIKLKLIEQLKNEGINPLKIGLIFNISEYEVKRLIQSTKLLNKNTRLQN